MSDWNGPWKCDKCDLMVAHNQQLRRQTEQCPDDACHGKLAPYERRASPAPANPEPALPALKERIFTAYLDESSDLCQALSGGAAQEVTDAIIALTAPRGESADSLRR